MNKKILITGISGFVGSNLIHYLKQNGYSQLYGLTSSPPKCREKFDYGIHIIDYEEFKTGLNESFDVVIHLAGKVHDVKNIVEEDEYYSVNVGLTKEVFELFLRQPGDSQFIFVSSVKAVTDIPRNILNETDNPNPSTVYGKSKLMAEDYILKNSPDAKRVYILRPCMIHGPGNKGNLNTLYSYISHGLPWILGAFDNKRSYLSIENFSFVIKEILTDTIRPGVYNVADSQPISTNELIQLISLSSGVKGHVWKVPVKIINLCAKTAILLHVPYIDELFNKLTKNYIVSNTKLLNELGGQLPVDVEEGLRKTFESFNNIS